MERDQMGTMCHLIMCVWPRHEPSREDYTLVVQYEGRSPHASVLVQVMKPKDFAQQINLNMDNCWGIVRALVDLCMKQEDGKYLLVKDPNKQLLRLYSVPEDAFQVEAASDVCMARPLPAHVTCPR